MRMGGRAGRQAGGHVGGRLAVGWAYRRVDGGRMDGRAGVRARRQVDLRVDGTYEQARGRTVWWADGLAVPIQIPGGREAAEDLNEY